MIWIDARWIIATVENVPFRMVLSAENKPGNTVRQLGFPPAADAYCDYPVASTLDGASP